MFIAPGVSIRGIRPEMLVAFYVIDQVYNEYAKAEARLSSGTNGKHMRASLHYVGQAGDFSLPPSNVDVSRVVSELRTRLGAEYDVVLERTHIHIEYQPKEAVNT